MWGNQAKWPSLYKNIVCSLSIASTVQSSEGGQPLYKLGMELGTLTEWEHQQWECLQTPLKVLVKIVRRYLQRLGNSPSEEILLRELSTHLEMITCGLIVRLKMTLTRGPKSLFGSSTAFWPTDHIPTIPKPIMRSKQLEGKKKLKQVILPEMVSQYLVNQQRQYLEQSHNHQIVHSDSHIQPAGFIKKN